MDNPIPKLAHEAGETPTERQNPIYQYEQYTVLFNELKKVGLNENNKVDLSIIERILEDKNNEIERLKEKIRLHKSLFEEIKKQHNEVLSEAKKSIKKSTGRPKKTLDIERYNALKNAGANDKQIAEILKMGVSTLRRLKNETAQK